MTGRVETTPEFTARSSGREVALKVPLRQGIGTRETQKARQVRRAFAWVWAGYEPLDTVPIEKNIVSPEWSSTPSLSVET